MYEPVQSKFQFQSAGVLASRRLIEEPSHTTTPGPTPHHSPADPVPPCCEAIYRRKALDKEGLEAVGGILKLSQALEMKEQEPFSKKTTRNGEPTTGKNGVKEDELPAGRELEPSRNP